VARDLHDEIGQSLTALKLLLQAATSGRPTPTGLAAGSAIVDQILQQVRDLSLSLHPTALEELGLSWALKGHVEQEGRRAGLDVDLQVDSIDEPLPGTIATACFRIAQEAFTNVIRHAAATRVLVRLRRTPDGLELLVRDNGVGVATRPVGNSLGLAGMRERARLLGGLVLIETRAIGGTDVLATLPLPQAPVSRAIDDSIAS
jgi:signal transduction histidine kinase